MMEGDIFTKLFFVTDFGGTIIVQWPMHIFAELCQVVAEFLTKVRHIRLRQDIVIRKTIYLATDDSRRSIWLVQKDISRGSYSIRGMIGPRGGKNQAEEFSKL